MHERLPYNFEVIRQYWLGAYNEIYIELRYWSRCGQTIRIDIWNYCSVVFPFSIDVHIPPDLYVDDLEFFQSEIRRIENTAPEFNAGEEHARWMLRSLRDLIEAHTHRELL